MVDSCLWLYVWYQRVCTRWCGHLSSLPSRSERVSCHYLSSYATVTIHRCPCEESTSPASSSASVARACVAQLAVEKEARRIATKTSAVGCCRQSAGYGLAQGYVDILFPDVVPSGRRVFRRGT